MRLLLTVWLCFLFPFAQAKTVAISYFDNTSGDVKFNALSKGIADMLITDLSKVQGVTIVEREKLEKLLQEIKLGQSKYFDQNTAQKLGKGLGAQNILTGSYYILENTIRIDARIIDVETGGIIASEQVTGSKSNFFELHKQLATLLTKSIKVSYNPDLSDFASKNKDVELTAVVNYSNAIVLQDQGMQQDAEVILEQTVKKYPKFNVAKNKLDELRKWIELKEKERDKLLDEEFRNAVATLDTTSDKFGIKLNNTWATLLTGYKYNQILQFNNLLRSKNYNQKKKLFGEYSPMTLGEMILFYDCSSFSALKKHAELLETGKIFMTEYPISMYYQSIKMQMDQSIKELEDREKGRKNMELQLDGLKLDAYCEYLNKLKWKSNQNFISEEEYKDYRNLYENTVMNVNASTIHSWDQSNKFDYLTSFFEVAEAYNDIKTMENILAFSKKTFTGTNDESGLYSLEQQLIQAKKNVLKIEERGEQLEAAVKGGSKEESEDILNNLRDYEDCNKPKLILALCENYIKNKPKTEKENDRYLKAWRTIVLKTAVIKGLDEAAKKKEDFKKQGAPNITSAEESNNAVRLIENEFISLKSQYDSYLLYFKNINPSFKVLELNARAYSDNHMYLEEASTRQQILDQYKLTEDQETYQLYSLVMAYNNQGYFDNARKTAKILSDKYPRNNMAQSAAMIVNFMPK